MNISYRKKIICVIKNHTEMEEFIKNKKLYKFFLKFSNDKLLEVKNRIKSTENLTYKGIKPWLKSILNYPETIYNEKFLHSMGWEEFEIKSFISERQKNNSKILSENKKNNPNKYNRISPKRIEYWMEKGFSINESKEKISESQKTFSKQICIQKYGEENGLKIFNERQLKWLNTLFNNKNYSDFQIKKNSYNYGSKPINDIINQSSFLEVTKKIILENINIKTIHEFVIRIVELVDFKSYSDIIPFLHSKIIQNHYNVSGSEIKKLFYNTSGLYLTTTIYGTPIYHNGNRFKSIKEYKLALLFEEKKIQYEYEKRYPDSKYKSDFYLPSKNLYIEYYGMLDKKNFNRLDEVQLEYKNKMEIKNLYCKKNNLYLIYDTDFEKLIKTINNIL